MKPIAGVAIRKSDGHRITIDSDTPVECSHPFHEFGEGGTVVSEGRWGITHCPVDGCDATAALHRVLEGGMP